MLFRSLHDLNALVAARLHGLSATIVLVNNDGGGIFSFLPQAATLPGEQFEQLFGTPHGTDIVAIARAHGLGAVTANTIAELQAALVDPAITVVRVQSERASNVAAHDRLNAAVATALTRR